MHHTLKLHQLYRNKCQTRQYDQALAPKQLREPPSWPTTTLSMIWVETQRVQVLGREILPPALVQWNSISLADINSLSQLLQFGYQVLVSLHHRWVSYLAGHYHFHFNFLSPVVKLSCVMAYGQVSP